MLEFATFYRASIKDRLASRDPVCGPYWTEAVAVGSRDFVDAAVRTAAFGYRRKAFEWQIVTGVLMGFDDAL